MTARRVVLAGGSGFLGQRFAGELLAAGCEVDVLTRSPGADILGRAVAWDGSTVGDWARVLEGADYFDIGRRNLLSAKRLLWQHGLMIHAEDCGGSLSRSLKLCLADGAVTVKTPGLERPLATPTASRS